MRILKKQLKEVFNEIESKEIYASDTDIFVCHEFNNIHISFNYNLSSRCVSEFKFYIGETMHNLDNDQYNDIIAKLDDVSLGWLSMRNENLEQFELNGIYHYN